jgi:hypothetical protein
MRRRQLPEELIEPFEAFLGVLEQIEPAKAGLANVLPSTRLPGRPLRDAVAGFRHHLIDAQALMPDWRCPELETEWLACDAGVSKAVALADRLLASPDEPVAFEGLLATVERLMDPLDPFVSAAERFRRLRRRPGPLPMLGR